MSKGVDSIRASSRSRCQGIAISDSSVCLPEWWKSRIKTIKASQHYVQQNLNVVFGRSRSGEIGRTILDRFVRCCALFFMFHYIRPYTVIVLALSGHRELHQLERVFPESLNLYSRSETRGKRKRLAPRKRSTYLNTHSPSRSASIDFSRLLRQKSSVS